MSALTLKREKLLGGVKRPAGHILASIEPTAPLTIAEVRLVLQLGAFDLLATPGTREAVLHLKRTKVLAGVTCMEGHRVATFTLPAGQAIEDVRLVLQTGEYELGAAPAAAAAAPAAAQETAPPAEGPGDPAEGEASAPARARRSRAAEG